MKKYTKVILMVAISIMVQSNIYAQGADNTSNTTNTEANDNRTPNTSDSKYSYGWNKGWIGLIGLLGLAGLWRKPGITKELPNNGQRV